MDADFAVVAARYPRASRAVLHQYLGWWSLRVGRHRYAGRYFLRAAAAREARYPVGQAGRDLATVTRHAARHARARLVPRRARAAVVVVRHPEWRERGRRWVEQLPPQGISRESGSDR